MGLLRWVAKQGRLLVGDTSFDTFDGEYLVK